MTREALRPTTNTPRGRDVVSTTLHTSSVVPPMGAPCTAPTRRVAVPSGTLRSTGTAPHVSAGRRAPVPARCRARPFSWLGVAPERRAWLLSAG
jgi:hypothetical protein